MDDSHPVVELRMPYRVLRWDMGLFFIVSLGIVTLSFFYADFDQTMHDATGEKFRSLDFRAHVFFSIFNVALTLGALAMWLRMDYVKHWSKVRIEKGRIKGVVYNATNNWVDIDIGEIRSIEVEKDKDGHIVSLILNHKDEAVALAGFSELESALNAIRCWRPDGINVLSKVPPPVLFNLLLLTAAFAALAAAAASIYVRFHPYEGMLAFALTTMFSLNIRLDLLSIIRLSKQWRPDFQVMSRGPLFRIAFQFGLIIFVMFA